MSIAEGRTTIITGAGRGIGRAVAAAFVREGARVVVNDLGTSPDGVGADPTIAETAATELRSSGGEAMANADDVATREGAERLIEQAVAAFGRVDTLVCCAGFLRDALIHKTDEAALDAVLSVHVKGTFHCLRAAAERMKRQGGGRIVTTTALAGFLGNYGQVSYSAAAAAVYALTRTASIELQRFSITVNAVAPIAKTRLTEALPMFEHVDSMTAEHVAPAYLFFGSDLCGDQSGNVLAVAGGKMSAFRMSESSGRLKEVDQGVWSAEEIQKHWDVLTRERA